MSEQRVNINAAFSGDAWSIRKNILHQYSRWMRSRGNVLLPKAPSVNGHYKRVAMRHLASTPCTFRCSHGSYTGVVRNSSIDGAFISTDHLPSTSLMGDLQFENAMGKNFSVLARVVHNTRAPQVEGFGLYFLEFGEDNLELLEDETPI